MASEKFHKAIILLGSNINPEKNIEKAKVLLEEMFEDITCSESITTKPIGYKHQQDFNNAAARITTELEQEKLKSVLNSIEDKLGRQRDPSNKNGPRTIDLDIVMFDGKTVGNDFKNKPFTKNLVSQLGISIEE